MARVLIAYSTVDGHTRQIATRLGAQLTQAGDAVTVASVAERGIDVAAAEKVVIGAAVRYGKHRPEVNDFVERNLALLQARPTAFFSVNLVARKPGKDTAQGNPYVREFLRKSAWRPALVAAFAGKLDYARYGFRDRHVIRLIMLLTGGPTDPQACVDFTDWAAVASFGQRVAAL